MSYTLGQIAKIVNGKLLGQPQQPVQYLLYDSRRLVPGSESLFFAFVGRRDGHRFIPEMYRKGVKNFIVRYYQQSYPPGNYIIVDDPLKALQRLAQYHRSKFSLKVIGITGSNGKTIVKDWLRYVLSKYFSVVASPKSFNSQLGVPLSVWEIKEYHQLGIFEAGISRPGEMQNLEQIIRPQIGILTNLGDAHQENFSSYEEKLEEKLKLFKNAEIIICPSDEAWIVQRCKEKFTNSKLYFWGFKDKVYNKLQIVNYSRQGDFTVVTGVYKGKERKIRVNFTDFASIYNAIIVWFTSLILLPEAEHDNLDFSDLPRVKMRLEQIKGIRGCTLINDSYNCDLTSLRIALDFLSQQSKGKGKVLILSDLEQVAPSGDSAGQGRVYSEVAEMVTNAGIDRFFGVGKILSNYSRFFKNAWFYDTTDEFLKQLPVLNFHDEFILIKGARRFKFERITRYLQQKSHRTVFEINLNALKSNLDYFRSYLRPETKLMVMVKAFAYGSGSVEVASLLQAEGVDYLGVAIADEGVELREAGISLPIIVMNPDSDNFDLFLEYDLEPEIYNFRMLNKFYAAVKDKVHYPASVHIKINTGMNRMGFDLSEVQELILRLKQMTDVIRVKSVFSHLAGSSEQQFDDFTLLQISRFDKVVRVFKQEFGSGVIAHILNSGGIERFGFAQYDMVRLGIGLYGISAVPGKRLKSIGTLKTHISQIRYVKKGESIGYSRAQFVERDSKIAIIPIGYADGLSRKLSRGRGKVWVKGKLVPIVGNVNMDMTMIDVTDVPEVEEDDEVIIFGENPTLEQMAEWVGTIPYEVLTSISSRVKRIYTWE